MNRRSFAQKLGSGMLALGALTQLTFLTACSVFDNILKYVAVGLQSFQAVVDLLAGAGVIVPGLGTVIDAAIALVKAGLADLQVVVTAYENAPADQKATLLQKVSLALAIAEANIQQFWSELKIPDAKLSSLVKGLLEIILSTLAGFGTQLPPPPTSAVLDKMKSVPRGLTVTPIKRSASQFKKDFNGVLSAGGYSQYAVR